MDAELSNGPGGQSRLLGGPCNCGILARPSAASCFGWRPQHQGHACRQPCAWPRCLRAARCGSWRRSMATQGHWYEHFELPPRGDPNAYNTASRMLPILLKSHGRMLPRSAVRWLRPAEVEVEAADTRVPDINVATPQRHRRKNSSPGRRRAVGEASVRGRSGSVSEPSSSCSRRTCPRRSL